MKKKFDRVYQFKVTLRGVRPPIWRRIQVPETYSFWELHVAIQDAMGWSYFHLHEFEVYNDSTGMNDVIGIPDEEFSFGTEILPGWKRKISKYFIVEKMSADYTYDFGDDWRHKLVLEKILPRNENSDYPLCIGGRRACPPEDCGGTWGYEEICSGKSESQEEYADYDPECFDVKDVIFEDPAKIRKMVLG